MTPRLSTPIARHLRATKTWQNAAPLVRAAFKERMRNRAYGAQPTVDAWEWFRSGWVNGQQSAQGLLAFGATNPYLKDQG